MKKKYIHPQTRVAKINPSVYFLESSYIPIKDDQTETFAAKEQGGLFDNNGDLGSIFE